MNLIEIERHRRTVTSRYGVTSYLDIGTGPPAVFVHGLATSAYLWRNVFRGWPISAAAWRPTCRCTATRRVASSRTSP